MHNSEIVILDNFASLKKANIENSLLHHEDAGPFHTIGWGETLCRTYNYRPFYIIERAGRDILGMLPLIEIDSWLTGRRGVCLPFTDCCHPLALNKDNLAHYIDAAINIGHKRKWKFIEFKTGKEPAVHQNVVYKRYLNHKLFFEGEKEEAVFKKFRSSTKRNIKKAIKSNITTRKSHAYEDLCIFYQLNCLTRKDHGLPPQPFKFFRTLFENIISNGEGFVVLAEKEGIAIAGGLYLQFGKCGIYKYGASDKRFQSYRANNLVMWHAIQAMISSGAEYLDFGRTDPHHKGLLQFKRGWGTTESEVLYYKYDLREKGYQKGEDSPERSYSLFSKMPIHVLKLLGRILYRHVG